MSCLTDPFRRFSPSGMVSRTPPSRSAPGRRPRSIRTRSLRPERLPSVRRDRDDVRKRRTRRVRCPRSRRRRRAWLVIASFASAIDRAVVNSNVVSKQFRGFATCQGEKLGERGARREFQPSGRSADRQGRETQLCARDDAEGSLASAKTRQLAQSGRIRTRRSNQKCSSQTQASIPINLSAD
jgi:hypothetical protein